MTEAFARLVGISGSFHSGSDLGTVSAAVAESMALDDAFFVSFV